MCDVLESIIYTINLICSIISFFYTRAQKITFKYSVICIDVTDSDIVRLQLLLSVKISEIIFPRVVGIWLSYVVWINHQDTILFKIFFRLFRQLKQQCSDTMYIERFKHFDWICTYNLFDWYVSSCKSSNLFPHCCSHGHYVCILHLLFTWKFV